MRTRPIAFAVAAFAVASLAYGLSAHAEDPPAGMPPPPKKIESPFLKAAVGEWTVSWTGTEPSGTSSGKSTSKMSMAVGDTALVEDYSAPDMMPGGFHGHGVMRVSADGKTLTTWWFDSMGHEPVKLTGPLTDTTATIEGTIPGMGPIKIVMKQVEGGLDFEGTMSGKPWLSQQYRKGK